MIRKAIEMVAAEAVISGNGEPPAGCIARVARALDIPHQRVSQWWRDNPDGQEIRKQATAEATQAYDARKAVTSRRALAIYDKLLGYVDSLVEQSLDPDVDGQLSPSDATQVGNLLRNTAFNDKSTAELDTLIEVTVRAVDCDAPTEPLPDVVAIAKAKGLLPPGDQ